MSDAASERLWEALESAKGNISAAAALAGCSRSTVHRAIVADRMRFARLKCVLMGECRSREAEIAQATAIVEKFWGRQFSLFEPIPSELLWAKRRLATLRGHGR